VRRLLQRLALYAFHVIVVRPILFLLVDLRYRRRHLVPDGPCLVVSNHNSHLDAAVLMTLFPLRRLPYVHPVAAADYFGTKWWKRAMAMLLMNGIPIERKAPRGSDPLEPVVEKLRQGESLIFFPEGSRGKAGVVAPFRRGIGLLVRQLPGLLVVPVFLSGPERIWPRGEAPVPLAIDALVGRPRSYSAELDPKEIADKVREDVLALAPPPPPVPGSTAVQRVRVAFCSIDAELRASAFRETTRKLGRLAPTVGVDDPVLEADGEGMREATGPIPVQPIRFWLRVMTWVFRASSRFRKDEFARRVERAQVDEALDHSPDTPYVVVEDSALLNFLAFVDATHGPEGLERIDRNRLLKTLTGRKQVPLSQNLWFLRKAPEVWLINVFDLVRTPVPDILVHLRVPVEQVTARLRSEGGRQGPFDGAPFLGRLDASYQRLAQLLRKRHRVQVLELEGDEVEPAAVAARVAELCRSRAQQAATV
jgi:1-acyl-sn-glycerol-3-phosphate acyltransferase